MPIFQKRLQEILTECVERLNGQPRKGQQKMVDLVDEAFKNKMPLILEAGTGTGKSLGYLVPLFEDIYQGNTCLLSTSTLALQNQIFNKDIPIVTEVFQEKINFTPKVAILKGWSNYLCLHKLNGGFANEGTLFYEEIEEIKTTLEEKNTKKLSARAKKIMQIRQWAEKTKNGDKDELDIEVDEKTWAMFSLSTLECLNKKCPFYNECFPMKARRKAQESDLVITNHAILGISINNSESTILPPFDTLVVDEAHDLEKRVISQATITLNVSILGSLLQRLRKINIVDIVLEKELSYFSDELLKIKEGWLQEGLPEKIVEVIKKIHVGLLKTSTQVADKEKNSDKDIALLEKILLTKSILSETIEIIEKLLAFSPENNVMWCHHSIDGKQININMSPLNVSKTIYDGLVQDRSCLFTSATLSVGKSFERICKTLGFKDKYCHKTAKVESPFDYSKQGILYVASDLPSPSKSGISDENLARLQELLLASNGGALCLFSSMVAAKTAAEFMSENTSLEILMQGEGVLSKLINDFRTKVDSCLFGTLSLWQGVDVCGSSARLVVIDRIPFARPNDPVHLAKCDLVTKNGGNAFMSVTLPDAALLLSQGAGRLVRRVEDKGVLAILDSRIVNARYGGLLRSSMPSFWFTTNLEIVKGSLNNLGEGAKV